MSGGLMQLVALGAQDVYLTSDPTITFWKSVYRRHTNHAVESVQNTFSGNPDFGKKITATISRNGDLVSNMYLEVTLPPIAQLGGFPASYVNNVGLALIRSVEIEIGGSRIDKTYGEFMHMTNQLSLPAEKKAGYDKMVGGYGIIDESDHAVVDSLNVTGGTYYIPLQFWFCNGNPGSALPLIALQYHEVRVSIELRKLSELVRFDTATHVGSSVGPSDYSISDASLYVDYVFLDTDERTKFSQATHEYLITQTQFLGDESLAATTVNHKIRMNLNHPVKAVYWVITRDGAAVEDQDAGNRWFDFGGTSPKDVFAGDANFHADRVVSATISLNGHERFSARKGSYFRLVQPFQHHTRIPDAQVFMYSFCLNCESAQPSGSCNFSRIDNSTLMLTVDAANALDGLASKIKIFGVNYNVLRILSGCSPSGNVCSYEQMSLNSRHATKSFMPRNCRARYVGKSFVHPAQSLGVACQ